MLRGYLEQECDLSNKRAPLNITNALFLTLTPLVAAVGVPWYLIREGFGWPEWITFGLLWLTMAVSVTAGYHRLFAHRAYEAAWPVRLFFLIFGAGALENSVLAWSSDHRIHHSFVDQEKDPYNIRKGFWWAHIGWIFFDHNVPNHELVKDLSKDPLVRWQDRWYTLIGVSVAFGIPLLVGLATGRVVGALLIGGVLRIVTTHHVTFFINSLCHMIGRQPYSLRHSGRDSTIMAALAFGEGYHNYHHTFAWDYRNGVKRWHFDPAKWTIYGLSLVGLTRNLRRASDASIVKAKVEVQFERARRRMARLETSMREACEQRLSEAYRSIQAAIQEQLRQRRGDRLNLAELRQAMREWQQAVRATRKLARAVA